MVAIMAIPSYSLASSFLRARALFFSENQFSLYIITAIDIFFLDLVGKDVLKSCILFYTQVDPRG